MTTPEPIAPSELHNAIARKAADYCQRRHFWSWSEPDQAELDAWLAESFLHRAAYLRVEGTVARTGQLTALRPVKLDGSGPAAAKSRRRRFVFPLLAAASVALIVAIGIPLANYLMQPPIRTYSTDVGGRTLINFADNTQIELNTDTVVRFRMTSRRRTVWLDKGEAWFNVAHNAADPFTVFVGGHRITDLGTEFVVRRASNGLEVALLNGRATLNGEGAPTTMLVPGDDAVATQVTVSVTQKTPQALADELAWRRGVLVFRNTALSDVVHEFNRYNQTKLVITDPAVARMTLGGEFKANNLDHFLSLAQAVLGLRIEQQGNEILLVRDVGGAGRAAHANRSHRGNRE